MSIVIAYFQEWFRLVFFFYILLYFSKFFVRQQLPLFTNSITMKIGVISDTHLKEVNSHLIEIYTNYFSDVDMIIHTGDLISGEIVDFLSQKPLNVVHGNMDNFDIKKKFPKKKILEVHGFRLGLIHGWGSPFGIEKRIRPEFDNIHAIIYGHSHKAVNHIDNGVIFFNPGTATGFSISGSHSIGILEVSDQIYSTIIRV
jgi:putative phosphoesterase